MPYEIKYLADHLNHIDTVAKWYWDEWDQHEEWDFSRSYQFVKNCCNKNKLDIILIALNEAQDCIGTIQLRRKWGLGAEPPKNLKQYTPWLGSLYVHPEYRNKKLGFELCSALEKAALDIGIKKCYAATSHLDSFFKFKNGVIVNETHFANEDMRIFEFSLEK